MNKQEAIHNHSEELERIEELEYQGEIDMEDFENELRSLLMKSLTAYFGGAYTELNGKSLRISDHPQGTIYHSPSDFSFVITTFSKNNSGVDYPIRHDTNIKEAINYIVDTVN